MGNLTDLQMFAKAGRDGMEVPLHILLMLVPREGTERIAAELKMTGTMARIGMTRLKAGDEVLALVAAYMGWLPVDVPEDTATEPTT